MASAAGKHEMAWLVRSYGWASLVLALWVGSACTFPGYAVGSGPYQGGAAPAGMAGALGGATASGTSGSGGTAATSSCTDGMANGDETGVDCGGACAACEPVPCAELLPLLDLEAVVGREALVAWYRFSSAEDMTADASPAMNHAISSMNVSQVSDAERGCVARFVGDGELVIPPVVMTHATLALWIRTEVSGRGVAGDAWHVGSGLLDGEQMGSVNDFGLCLVGAQAAFGVGNPDVTVSSTTEVDDGAWHHVAATRDDSSGQILLYVDGMLEAQMTGATGARAAVSALHAGRGRLVADLADVRLYGRVLSPDEVASIPAGK